ncbi:molybdenum ABC transporter ATP-binding protein [Aerophototrophica crusticola]|uniref:Molybdenum ABC transporter ATP-binding protein n=1 Tax=Aerophototrophica crusticola TaxID=1709002 RepID=A0A858R4G8_9PROT|nr:molybdenum ABC transporter ATP-binding protein [Rhodospirillaceae bacterium B3]
MAEGLSVSLRHRQGDFTVEADFRAGPGVTALFGRSGAGKTTLLRAVAGLLRPQQGRITLGGRVFVDTGTGAWLPPHRRRVGYVFQDARLFPHLTVRQNLAYGRWFAGRGGATTVPFDDIVGMLGIVPLLGRRPGGLSGGERQRVAIGRALLAGAEVLLLDEPLASLDAARRAEILPYLERLRDGLDLPILHVSHSLAEVVRLATALVLVEQGRVVASGPLAAMLARPDLAALFGRFGTATLLEGTVEGHDPAWELTRVATPAGPLLLPRLDRPVGAAVRLRVLARDVLLSTRPPRDLSARNVLPGMVTALLPGTGAEMEASLDMAGQPLTASLTRLAAAELGLAPGQPVWAVVKAVAVVDGGTGLD